MGMHQFIQGLNDLELLRRAPGYFKYQEHTVAAHSFRVAEIAQLLADIEEDDGQKINWQMVYEKALNHDYTERFIGDIKTPVKYATHDLRQRLAQVEAHMTENFIQNEIPARLQARYQRRLSEGKDESLEGRILSVADKVDLLYESFGEIQKGNPESVYTEIFRESLTTILQFDQMASTRYFIKGMLPELLNEEFLDKPRLVKLTQEIIAAHQQTK
ncbi:HD domain-containing protein [Lactobacillus sp. CC-MHH1034]|uniref:YfbR-like 5'-deoxynucleotidase n=1 Tax=Agrilactobacillus fermenti TaxID=2586909 RepID=UPI001E3A0394|nr:YfbR-like 5'-deoxynucleotidase [Agrilactobacillus fermenti]MCD2256851.1 HD domain-containing protein [Agrilactobacillus fermenti]